MPETSRLGFPWARSAGVDMAGSCRWLVAGTRMAAIAVLAVALVAMLGATGALAQQGPGGLVDPQRDCQTVLTCNFKRGGSYRGCLSSYSCRLCRMVPARCSVGNRRGVCQQVRCSWGA